MSRNGVLKMAKPENAKAFGTSIDICECALEHALLEIGPART